MRRSTVSLAARQKERFTAYKPCQNLLPSGSLRGFTFIKKFIANRTIASLPLVNIGNPAFGGQGKTASQPSVFDGCPSRRSLAINCQLLATLLLLAVGR